MGKIGRDEQRRIVVIKYKDTPSSSSKNAPSTTNLWGQLVSQVDPLLPSKDYESDSSFMNTGTYYRASYSSDHVTSKCCQLKQGTHFDEARNRNYKHDLKWNMTNLDTSHILLATTPHPMKSLKSTEDFHLDQ